MNTSDKWLTISLFCITILILYGRWKNWKEDFGFKRIYPVQQNESNKLIVGYYAGWTIYPHPNFYPSDIHVEDLTYINYAFAKVEDGVVTLGDKYGETQKMFPGDETNSNLPFYGIFNQLNNPNGALRKRNPHIRTLVSVGGWSYSKEFSDIAATHQARWKFVKSACDFMLKYGFEGIDIDWEFPQSGGMDGNSERPNDGENLFLLLKLLREQLDNLSHTRQSPKYLLTTVSSASEYHYRNLPLRQISEVVDWINVMAYDFYGSWSEYTGHNSNLYNWEPHPHSISVKHAVDGLLNEKVPSTKIVVGLGFYGRGFNNVQVESNDISKEALPGLHSPFRGVLESEEKDGAFTYAHLRREYLGDYKNTTSIHRFWDSKAHAAFLFDYHSSIFITYEDVQSVRSKASFVNQENLGGCMIWHLSSDYNNELGSALKDGLFAPVKDNKI